MRTALGDAAPLYRDAPEAAQARASGSLVIREFMKEALPGVDEPTVVLAADVIETTLTQVGSSFSGTERTSQEISAYADAMADMFCGYLARLSR